MSQQRGLLAFFVSIVSSARAIVDTLVFLETLCVLREAREGCAYLLAPFLPLAVASCFLALVLSLSTSAAVFHRTPRRSSLLRDEVAVEFLKMFAAVLLRSELRFCLP